MATIGDALLQIKDDPELVKRFTEEPEPVLRELGVDTDQVSIQHIPGGNAPYENFAKAMDEVATEERMTVCGSVGYVVCASAGG